MARLSLVSGDGTSSSQAEYWVFPFTTFADGPICSRAFGFWLARPRPTQEAEYPVPESAETAGWTQLPETLEKCWPSLLCATYPAQFWLCSCWALTIWAEAVAPVT